jgi:ParB family chromosome partitioning protein
MTDYEFHEYANLFPMMNEEQFTSLVDSVSIGFNEKHPITLYEGKILDGRNRYLACLKAEVTPIFKEFVGDSDAALRFVRIENLERNHYNEAQRAMVGAKLKSVFEEQAKQRQVEAAKVGGGKTSEDFYEKTVTKVENKVKVNLPFQESGQ